jgi:hypothetical protein
MAANHKAEPTRAVEQSSPFAVYTVNALSYLRVAAGASCILAPTFTGKLFRLAVAPNSFESALVRLLGFGPVVLGELTWFNRPKLNTVQSQAERTELRHNLWANVAWDALEGGIILYAASKGQIPRPAALCFGGAAAGLMAMGLYALREV